MHIKKIKHELKGRQGSVYRFPSSRSTTMLATSLGWSWFTFRDWTFSETGDQVTSSASKWEDDGVIWIAQWLSMARTMSLDPLYKNSDAAKHLIKWQILNHLSQVYSNKKILKEHGNNLDEKKKWSSPTTTAGESLTATEQGQWIYFPMMTKQQSRKIP